VTDTTSSAVNALQSLGLTQQATRSTGSQHNQLGQADFLTLLTAQMKSQDPTNPMDSQQFLAQLAQFTTVQGIQDLQKSVTSLASSLATSQTLQSAQLLGHSVLVPSSSLTLGSSGAVSGAVDLPQGVSTAIVKISTPSGQVVRTISVQGNSSGLADFTWDGLDDAGKAVAPGQYQVTAGGSANGSAQTFDTLALVGVNSVSIDPTSGQAVLSAGQLGDVTLNQVRQIR
jgi:flagellar basal-body rod modification protein FlgD